MNIEIKYCPTWANNKSKAASLAALITERLKSEVSITAGKTGQFDVVIDGETIVTRGGNIITRRFGAGYPDFETVLELVAKKLNSTWNVAEKHETDVPSTLICARHNNPTGVEDFKIFNVGGVKIAVIG